MSDYDPFDHARQLGIPVEWRDEILVRGRARDGAYSIEPRRIVLRNGMLRIQERCVLAHEIAHDVLGHVGETRKQEVLADRLAAGWLIDHVELVSYLTWTNDLPRVCLELNVTMRMMRMYLGMSGLSRRGQHSTGVWMSGDVAASA